MKADRPHTLLLAALSAPLRARKKAVSKGRYKKEVPCKFQAIGHKKLIKARPSPSRNRVEDASFGPATFGPIFWKQRRTLMSHTAQEGKKGAGGISYMVDNPREPFPPSLL